MTKFFIATIDVGSHEDILYPPPFDTREEAQSELQKLENNPKCEVPFYIVEKEVQA